jgi:hypothetical protein
MANVSYLSVNRYLRGGFGIDVPADYSRATLRNKLVQATTVVNSYCGAPSQPQAFDFRGGVVTGEQHQWPYIDPLLVKSGSRRVFLNQRPLVSVESFVLQLAENYTVTLNPATNVVVNKMEGYAEVVALTPVISGYFPVGWNFGLWNPLAVVDYTYGWTFGVVGDECEAESPTIFTASHGNWTVASAVYIDGVEQDPDDYTIKLDDGSITFDTEPDIDSVVTCDYTYNLPDAISQATGIVTTGLIASARMASRGMLGMQSIRVAEVALTALQPSQMVNKNGVSIPSEAADLLGRYTIGSAA